MKKTNGQRNIYRPTWLFTIYPYTFEMSRIQLSCFFCCQIWLNFLFVCYEKNKIFFCQTITCHSVDIGSPSNIHINILNVYAYLNLEERPFPVDVNNFTTRVFMVINRIFHILCNYYHHHRSHKNVWHSFFNENNKNEWPDFFCLLIFG